MNTHGGRKKQTRGELKVTALSVLNACVWLWRGMAWHVALHSVARDVAWRGTKGRMAWRDPVCRQCGVGGVAPAFGLTSGSGVSSRLRASESDPRRGTREACCGDLPARAPLFLVVT